MQSLMIIITSFPQSWSKQKIGTFLKKVQRLNRRKHFIKPWMNRELLTLINEKNDKYRDWKSTNNDVEYEL